MFTKKDYFLIFALTLLAAYLRFPGIEHGIGIHPDERDILNRVRSLSWENPYPHAFHYGHLPHYLLWAITSAIKAVGYELTGADYSAAGRALGIFISVLAIPGVALLGLRLSGSKVVAFLSALLLAVNIFHLQNSRFFTPDAPLTTVVVWALLFYTLIYDRGRVLDFILGGVLIGAALAVKISGLTLFLPFAYAVLATRHRSWSGKLALGTAGVLVALGVFAALQPYSIINLGSVYRDNLAEIEMVRGDALRPYTVQYINTPAYVYPIEQMLRHTLGWPLGIAALTGILYQIWQRLVVGANNGTGLLLWLLAVLLTVSGQLVKFPRYLLPIYPLLIIYGVILLVAIWSALNKSRFKGLAWVPVTVVLISSAAGGLALHLYYWRDHPYTEAGRWICSEVPAGSFLIHSHWDDFLPPSIPECEEFSAASRSYRSLAPFYDPDSRQKIAGLVEVLAEGDYLIFPTRRIYASIPRMPERYPHTVRLLQRLFAEQLGYRLIKVFSATPSWGPFQFLSKQTDESLVVYDHPKVLVFKNIDRFSPRKLMGAVLAPQSPADEITIAEMLDAQVGFPPRGTASDRYPEP